MRKRGEQVCLRIPDNFLQGLQVGQHTLDALPPASLVGFLLRAGTVAFRVFRRDVAGVSDELEDVPLGDTDVLHEMPEGIRGIGWFAIDVLQRKIGNHLGKAHMRVPTTQKLY